MIREGDRGVTVDDDSRVAEADLTEDENAVASRPEGRMEQLDVREVWADEAADFTPWLAENLDILGEEVGLDLELVETEKAVGSFYLDILAKDVDNGTLVAIENQLEWSDHGHLGQLLTYAAKCDAQVAIWIAPEFRYEHRETINRLNQWTGSEIQFYGVEVKIVRIGESAPAPDFRAVAVPDGWGW